MRGGGRRKLATCWFPWHYRIDFLAITPYANSRFCQTNRKNNLQMKQKHVQSEIVFLQLLDDVREMSVLSGNHVPSGDNDRVRGTDPFNRQCDV